jgi:hypothetical protein
VRATIGQSRARLRPDVQAGAQPRTEPKNLRAVRVEADSRDDVSAAIARTVTRPSVTAAETIDALKGLAERGCDINALVAELDAQVDRVGAGKMDRCESLLVAQAHTLDAIFNNLARRALKAEYLQQMDAFLRLAMKAQSQCRSTIETLAEIKNPRAVAFVTQANIAAGPQQINNAGIGPGSQAPDSGSGAREVESSPNKLLEHAHGGERLDGRAAAPAVPADSGMAAVDTLDGTRTAEGKRRVAQNAYRGGIRQALRDLRRALRQHKKGLAAI